jgi:dehydrogenase/reductase SDR family protein 7B
MSVVTGHKPPIHQIPSARTPMLLAAALVVALAPSPAARPAAAAASISRITPLIATADGTEAFWRGKRVFLTGASSGLGAALAQELSSRGARLVIAARREERLASVAASCTTADGEPAATMQLDVCQPADALEAKAAEAVALLGGSCDVFVSCAGLGQRTDVVDTSPLAHSELMGANFEGAVALSRALLPPMLDRGSGSIVAVSSVQGFFGQPGRASYAAAKAATISYFDALRAEVASRGVGVTVVCPGYIATEHSASAVGGDGKADGNSAKGMAPEELARQMADAVAEGRAELVASQFSGKAAMLLRRLAPKLLFKYLERGAAKP